MKESRSKHCASCKEDPMKISYIAIGDELLYGKIHNTNALWLAQYCDQLSSTLVMMKTVADNRQQIIQAIKDALKESNLVIISGGLGPTQDDITKEAIAECFNLPIIFSTQAKDVTKLNYQHLNIPLSDEGNYYFKIPTDVTALKNHCGLAPGLFYQLANKNSILATPGVPREFEAMIKHELPKLLQQKKTPSHHRITCRLEGISEEALFFKKAPTLWSELEKFGAVSSLPQDYGLDICLKISDAIHPDDVKIKTQAIKDIFFKLKLDKYIWQWGKASAAEYCISLARQKSIKISCAESCTGGLVSSMLTDVTGSSAVFMGSVISYSNETKVNVLKVNPTTLEQNGAVSEAVVHEMALGINKIIPSEISIALSGTAGPTGGSEDKPVGTLAFSILNHKDATQTDLIKHFRGGRLNLKAKFATFALMQVIQELKKL